MTSPSRKAELRLLQEVISVLAQRRAEDVLKTALDALIRLCGAERGFLVVSTPQGLEVMAARNVGVGHVVGSMKQVSHTLVERAIEEGKVLCYAEASAAEELKDVESVARLKLLSVLVVPLVLHEGLVCALYLENRRASGVFDPETAELADQFCKLACRAAALGESFGALKETQASYRIMPAEEECFEGIIGSDPEFLANLETVAIAARSELPILIQGETGTGKGLLARAAHRAGPRAEKPFVQVNCAAVPQTLLEDEMFGHVKGAFSGAQSDRRGLFAAADGGTIFLDEVAEMDLGMQAKLLTALEGGEVRQVGSDSPREVDVRVISAATKRLADEVSEGRFRNDLYYRLNGIRVQLPALRKRRGDIPTLVRHFIEQGCKNTGMYPPGVSEEAMEMLQAYDYPGNVRELENITRRSLLFLHGGRITPESLPPELTRTERGRPSRAPHSGEELKEAVAAARGEAAGRVEREFLKWVLDQTDGNVSEAARRTGINRSQLQQMLARHGMRGGRKGGGREDPTRPKGREHRE